MGHFVIELQFDRNSENILTHMMNEIGKTVSSSDFIKNGIVPHFTISAGEDISDLDALSDSLDSIAKKYRRFSIEMKSLDTFGISSGVIFVKPSENNLLKSIHQEIHENTSKFITNSDKLYFPNSWKPHITLANRGTEKEIRSILQEHNLGNLKQVTVTSIAIVEYFPAVIKSKHLLTK